MANEYYKPCRELDACNELIEKYFDTQLVFHNWIVANFAYDYDCIPLCSVRNGKKLYGFHELESASAPR